MTVAKDNLKAKQNMKKAIDSENQEQQTENTDLQDNKKVTR